MQCLPGVLQNSHASEMMDDRSIPFCFGFSHSTLSTPKSAVACYLKKNIGTSCCSDRFDASHLFDDILCMCSVLLVMLMYHSNYYPLLTCN